MQFRLCPTVKLILTTFQIIISALQHIYLGTLGLYAEREREGSVLCSLKLAILVHVLLLVS